MMSELLTGRIRLAEQEEKKTYEPILKHEPPMLKVAEESVEYGKARESTNAQN